MMRLPSVNIPALFVLPFVLGSLAGCAFHGARERVEHADAYLADQDELTRAVLGDRGALELDDCVEIALDNNLDIESARIQRRIADLERKTAFANFLPTLDLSMQYVTWDRQPKSKLFGPMAVPMHDQDMHELTLDIQWPVFMPATWFLYDMRLRASEISEWITEYTRQMVVFQVTALYLKCLMLDEAAQALSGRLKAAEALEREVSAFVEEGLAASWQADLAGALVLERRTSLRETQRFLEEARAELLAAMGLSPLAEIELAPAITIEAPEKELDALVLEALLNNPQLHIADRKVAVEKDRLRLAITEFLPKLAGFTSFSYTSNSKAAYSKSWMGGVQNLLTVFEGFANISRYKAAREQRRAAYLERERACLTLILQVIQAHNSLENAGDYLELAEKRLDAALGKYADVEAQWHEGLVDLPARLEARADKDGAQAQVTSATYQQQLAAAALLNVMGAGYAGYEVRNYEDEL